MLKIGKDRKKCFVGIVLVASKGESAKKSKKSPIRLMLCSRSIKNEWRIGGGSRLSTTGDIAIQAMKSWLSMYH